MTPTASSNRPATRTSLVRRVRRVVAALLVASTGATLSEAQEDVPRIRGAWGLKSGTQYPPGAYLGAFYYNYFPNKLIDKNGNASNFHFRQYITAPLLLYVSPKPILGTHWGAFATNGLAREVNSTDLTAPWGRSDTYVQPVWLGWSFPRADARVGFGFLAPTGRFKLGANNNNSLGFWSYAFEGGATVYPDSAKRWNLATLASFFTNSSVRGSNRRVGNVLMLEGGAGHGILKTGVIGLAYYAQWKVSDDKNVPVTLNPLFNARHRYYGLGPEITAPLPFKVPMLVQGRYFFERGNRVQTQGDAFWVFFTVYKPLSAKPRPPGQDRSSK